MDVSAGDYPHQIANLIETMRANQKMGSPRVFQTTPTITWLESYADVTLYQLYPIKKSYLAIQRYPEQSIGVLRPTSLLLPFSCKLQQ